MGKIFECKIADIKLDIGGYTKTLNKFMETQTRQAARAWLRAVIDNVPVYSGESRASLLPLGQYLRVAIPISPASNAIKRGLTDGVAKGMTEGRYEFKSNNFSYTFSFSTDVPQFLINEFNVGLGQPPLIHPTPWHALEHGERAFDSYMDKNLLSRAPKISDYIIISNG